jgi:anthranilate phosphoribosyltransferase
MGATRVVKGGALHPRTEVEVVPSDFGLSLCEVTELQGGEAQQNALILSDILSGRETGPKCDMVLINAGAAIACAGIAADISQGIEISREMIASGAALHRLKLMQKAAQSAT